jgi:hypothetical protein
MQALYAMSGGLSASTAEMVKSYHLYLRLMHSLIRSVCRTLLMRYACRIITLQSRVRLAFPNIGSHCRSHS